MRRFFLTLCWLLVTPLLGLVLLGRWRSPGLGSADVLMGLAHPAGSRLVFWFALLLLPLTIPPLLQAQRSATTPRCRAHVACWHSA